MTLFLTRIQNRRAFLLDALRRLSAMGLGWLYAKSSTAQVTDATALNMALSVALEGQHWISSSEITIEVPELAENGAMVPVSVTSHLPDTLQLLIFVERNPVPLSARFEFMPGALPWVSLRLRMNESSAILAIAKTPRGYFGSRREVRVMLGGCG